MTTPTPSYRLASEILLTTAKELFDQELGRTCDMIVGTSLALADPGTSSAARNQLADTMLSAAVKVQKAVRRMDDGHTVEAFRFLTWAQGELT